MAGALIVTADLGAADFATLDAERRLYFPPERNQLSAHLTMFHALPPSLEHEVRGQLKSLCSAGRPAATLAGLMNLGGGVAYRVVSPDLDAIRETIANHFHGSLSAQDAGGWRAHVTIQNKVPPRAAKELKEQLEKQFCPRPLVIKGLALHRYLGGPWEALGRWAFRAS
jgi:hypothetical protein